MQGSTYLTLIITVSTRLSNYYGILKGFIKENEILFFFLLHIFVNTNNKAICSNLGYFQLFYRTNFALHSFAEKGVSCINWIIVVCLSEKTKEGEQLHLNSMWFDKVTCELACISEIVSYLLPTTRILKSRWLKLSKIWSRISRQYYFRINANNI